MMKFLLAACLVGCAEDNSQPVASVPHAGKGIYDKNCKVCHAQGLNGAPILGNQLMWEKRNRSESEFVEHAANGFGLMPPNLGRNNLTKEQIADAVNYMLSELN